MSESTESSVPAVLRSEQRDGSATTADGVTTSGPEGTSLQGTLETEVRLRLKGDASLPRSLNIGLDRRYGWLTVHVLSARYRTVAFVSPKLSECRLEKVDPQGGFQLWADRTIFEVTPKEAGKIHATFAPLGLQSSFTP